MITKCECTEGYNSFCNNCEGLSNYKKLSPYNKTLVKIYLREIVKDEPRPAIRKKINVFEEKHGDITEFIFDGIFEDESKLERIG